MAILGFLDTTLPDLAANLALDEALLMAAEEGEGPPVLRIWEWPALAVVLGASGRLLEDVRVATCRADGVAIGRRSSGGGTVVLGPGALNMAVVLPIRAHPDLQAVDSAQRFVLRQVADALRALGPPVDVLGSGDLTIGLRKFAGSAQRRLRDHVLVHTSLLYRFPLDRVARYIHSPRRQPAYREARSHDDFLVNLDLPREAIVDAIRSAWLDPAGTPPDVPMPVDRVRVLIASKFADSAWIERL